MPTLTRSSAIGTVLWQPPSSVPLAHTAVPVAQRPHPKDWALQYFPRYFQNRQGQTIPFAPHHDEFWDWIAQIAPGLRVPAFIGVWARGGGKSSSVELAGGYIAEHRLRRYGLYLCGIQRQADDHVQNIASLLEQRNLPRAVGMYGQSKGWRRNRIRTDDFTLDAIGLDVAVRGAKIDADRPDIIFFDDLDEKEDSLDTILKKIDALTRKVLPTGAEDMIALGVQNLPHPDGIFTQLSDGRADFLLDRMVSGPHPAIRGLVTETEERQGKRRIRIVAGSPSWAGQSLAKCEQDINDFGLKAFLVECQHELTAAMGQVFKPEWWQRYPETPSLDTFKLIIQSWDMRFKETSEDGSYVVGQVWGLTKQGGRVYLLDEVRGRWGMVDTCEALVALSQKWPQARAKLVENKANGPAVVSTLRSRVVGLLLVDPIGSKYARAEAVAPVVQAGNVWIPAETLVPWAKDWVLEHTRFTGNDDEINDRVDAMSQAVDKLLPRAPKKDDSRNKAREQAHKESMLRARQQRRMPMHRALVGGTRA